MSLVFDHTLTEEERADNLRDAKTSLRELCAQSADGVRPDVPALFATFVRQARRLDTADFQRLYQQASNGLCDKSE